MTLSVSMSAIDMPDGTVRDLTLCAHDHDHDADEVGGDVPLVRVLADFCDSYVYWETGENFDALWAEIEKCVADAKLLARHRWEQSRLRIIASREAA